jgi:hypothetical protein
MTGYIAWGFDPVTREDFSLSVEDTFGGHATAAWTLEVFHDLALRHRITFWELLSMLKIATLGPESLEPPYDPLTELETLRRHAVRDARVLEGPCSLADAVDVLGRVRRYFEILSEHHPSPELRAKYSAEFRKSEAGMAAIAERQRGRIAALSATCSPPQR